MMCMHKSTLISILNQSNRWIGTGTLPLLEICIGHQKTPKVERMLPYGNVAYVNHYGRLAGTISFINVTDRIISTVMSSDRLVHSEWILTPFSNQSIRYLTPQLKKFGSSKVMVK